MSEMAQNAASFFYPGSRTGILLIHGLTGTPTEMKYVGKGLAQAGFTVYGMQLAGHCAGETELLATGWRDWYASVETAYEELRQKVDHVFVAGLSMGAVLALHLAAQRPEGLAGVALYSTTLWYDGWSVPWIGRLNFLFRFLLRLGIGRNRSFIEAPPYGIKDKRLRQRVAASMFGGDSEAAGLPGNPWRSLAELYDLVALVKAELRRIETPVLILHSDNDDVASDRNATYIERRLAGPVRKILLDDCYHMITVDKQRGEVVQQTAMFMTELTGPVAGAEPAVPTDAALAVVRRN